AGLYYGFDGQPGGFGAVRAPISGGRASSARIEPPGRLFYSRKMRRLALLAAAALLPGLLSFQPAEAAAGTHSCPADLAPWRSLLGAGWLDCHQVADLTTTGNPWTDPSSLYGMGFPPPGSGTLDSHYTNPTSPAVSGLQLAGWFP